MSYGSVLSSGGQPVLLWSKCCYSLRRALVTPPSPPSDFPTQCSRLESLMEIVPTSRTPAVTKAGIARLGYLQPVPASCTTILALHGFLHEGKIGIDRAATIPPHPFFSRANSLVLIFFIFVVTNCPPLGHEKLANCLPWGSKRATENKQGHKCLKRLLFIQAAFRD